VSSYDWRGYNEEIVLKILNTIKHGSIVLLHDNIYNFNIQGQINRLPTVNALDTFLKTNCNKYKFLTIYEILNLSNVDDSQYRRVVTKRSLSEIENKCVVQI